MRTLAVVLAFASFSALAACPDLTGTYATCRSSTGETSATDLVMKQKVKDGVTIYTATSTDAESQERTKEEFVADGKVYTETQTEDGLTITSNTTVTCKNDMVIVKADVSVSEQNVANIVMKISKEGMRLKQVTTGQGFGQEINETVVCE